MSDKKARKLYQYSGAIICAGTILAPKWIAATYAVSEKQARSNLKFQAKCFCNLAPNAKISLPGNLTTD